MNEVFYSQITQQKWAAKKNVQVPLIQKPYQVHGKFRFLPPSSVKVIGSYLLGACIRPDTHVDLALQIPTVSWRISPALHHSYLMTLVPFLSLLLWSKLLNLHLLQCVFWIQECFQAKDYLNQRYLRKRALYLTKLAIMLEGKEGIEELSFSHHHGNHMKPILIITPEGNWKS